MESNDWKSGYVTREYIKRVRAKIMATESYMGRGGCLTRESAEATLANTSHEVGRIAGLNDALKIIDNIIL